MKHELKTRERFFQAAWVGDKTFEIRLNDRKFKERDEIVLLEIDESGEYTGREIEGIIKYLTDYKQKKGYVVFSFEPTFKKD